MLTVLLLGLQSAVAGPPAPGPERPRSARACRPDDSDPGDVVVCARSQDEFRLKPLPDRYEEPALPRAAAALGPGTIATDTEQADVGGFPSNRIMLRYKIPF